MLASCQIISAQLTIHAVGINYGCSKGIGSNNFPAGTGAIRATATGGKPPYTYSLTGSGIYAVDNNGYFPQLTASSYGVFVTDATGAFADSLIYIRDTFPSPSVDVVYTPLSVCNASDAALTLNASGGTPPYLYSIDGGVTFSQNNVFNNLMDGVYSKMVMDANGCLTSNDPQPFIYNMYPAGGPQNLCKGSLFLSCTWPGEGLGASCSNEAVINVWTPYLVDSSGLTVKWDYSTVISLDGRPYRPFDFHSPQDTFAGVSPGLHYVHARDTITGQSTVFAMAINKSCSLHITFVRVDASCQQGDGALAVYAANGTPPYTYTMDGINYQTSNIFTGLTSGNYSVTVRDANGETSSDSGRVYNKCPIVSARYNGLCSPVDTLTASGTRGTQPYQFSIDGKNFQTDSVFAGIAAGTYTLTLKDANGFMDSTIVTINNNCLLVTATASNEYCGQKNGSITAIGSGGSPPYSYSIDGVNFQTTNIFKGLAAGNYTITIKDATSLTNKTAAIISNVPAPSFSLGNDTTLCSGQKLTLSVNIINATYNWQDGSKGSSYTVSQAGKYWATATTNGCTASDTIVVSYLDIGSIFTTHDTTACIGSNIVLDAKHAGAGFLWDDNSTKETRAVNTTGKYWVRVSTSGCSASDTITCNFLSPPTVALPSDTSFCSGKSLFLLPKNNSLSYHWSDGSSGDSLEVFRGGKYWVSITGTGCTTVDTISVSVKPNPQIKLGNDTTLCAGQTVTLNAAYANATYLWQDGSTQPLYTVTKQGAYSVDVTANGCDTIGKITVSYTTKPVINLGNDTTLCNTDKLVLDASYPQSSYLWQDGSTNPTFTVTMAGTYMVDVTNYCGTVKDSVAIQYENCACQFYIPSAFTPNGDGRNDVFKPSYKCFFTNYKMAVFDRFGKTIFTATNADNGWDGLVNGQQQPIGVYIWEISYTDTLTGKTVKRTGTVVLVR